MIEVSVEVSRRGSARFYLSVRAESIRGAVRMANDLYPGTEVRVVYPRVVYPIDPGAFFAKEAGGTTMGPFGLKPPESVAG